MAPADLLSILQDLRSCADIQALDVDRVGLRTGTGGPSETVSHGDSPSGSAGRTPKPGVSDATTPGAAAKKGRWPKSGKAERKEPGE